MPFVKTNTDEERLLSQRIVDPSTGCWNWTGYVKKATAKKNYLPYGYIHVGSRTDGTVAIRQVHRVAASIWMGLDLKRSEVHVLHTCDNPRCFNPDHLFFGNNISNVADRHAKGRDARRSGESSPNARLSLDQVRKIRSLQGTATHRNIAVRFGVTRSHVTAILAGRLWKDAA